MRGVGIFPTSEPRALAAGVLNLALVLQTKQALDCAGFSGKGALYVEGGSRRDMNYMGLLAEIYPEATVASTHL